MISKKKIKRTVTGYKFNMKTPQKGVKMFASKGYKHHTTSSHG